MKLLQFGWRQIWDKNWQHHETGLWETTGDLRCGYEIRLSMWRLMAFGCIGDKHILLGLSMMTLLWNEEKLEAGGQRESGRSMYTIVADNEVDRGQ